MGVPVWCAGGGEVGRVTSGTYSPTLDKIIAMAYVAPDAAEVDSELLVGEGRDQVAHVVELPFCRDDQGCAGS